MVALIRYPSIEMDDFSKALKAEVDKNLIKAANYYEDIIHSSQKPPLDVFINLMFLYFLAQDHGVEVSQNLTIDYMSKAYDRITPLYNQGKKLYPGSLELDFWENYIFYRYPYGPAYADINQKYFQQEQSIIPYFFVYNPENQAYEKEAKKLWEAVKNGKTFKERYIQHWIADGIKGRYTS